MSDALGELDVRIRDQSGAVNVYPLVEIKVPDGTLTDNGQGRVTLSPEGASDFENFSYEVIDTGVTKRIPIFQQMIVQGAIYILGDLIIDGTLVII